MSQVKTPTSPDFVKKAMSRAIELAVSASESGNYPLGAVVVSEDGNWVSEVSSALVKTYDPSAHPEVVAMRLAAEARQARYLSDCWLVTTMEPCPMCSSMAVWAKMKGIAYGTSQPEAISFGQQLNHPLFTFRQIRLRAREVLSAGDPKLALLEGVHSSSCANMLEAFGERIKALKAESGS
jgi:tRNA(adenine34) deaminase